MEFSLYLKNGTVITVDPDYRILHGAAIGIHNDTITYIGEALPDCSAERVLDCSGMVLLPGFIDSHAHAGHGLMKNIGEGIIQSDILDLLLFVYFQCSTPEFWFAEAQLSGLEKLRYGVTTAFSYLGSNPRYDDLVYAGAHVDGVKEIGIRDILGIGPANPPFPKTFRDWQDMQLIRTRKLGYEHALQMTHAAVKKFNNTNSGLTFSYPTPSFIGCREGLSLEEHKLIAGTLKNIASEFNTPIHGHSYAGDVAYAYEHLDILGPNVFIAHVTGISKEEIRILAETGTHVCSGPMTHAYVSARCPVVELLEAGVNVVFCSDASAPDRTYDLFEKMRIGQQLHRVHFHDGDLLPAGRTLRMVTIDAARAVGLDKLIGSLEVGKKADIICVDMQKPHLVPAWQHPLRMVYQASGHDVDSVIVNGRVLMESRKLFHVDESQILKNAQLEADKAVRRAGAERYLDVPPDTWTSLRHQGKEIYSISQADGITGV